jgi:hypothetical protein
MRHAWWIASLVLLACEAAPSTDTPTTATSTSATPASAGSASSGSASPSATSSSATSSSAVALKPTKPKAYAATAEDALGTLPDGVGLPVGSKAPDFSLQASDGKTVKLGDLLAKSEVLLTIYRGGW